MKKMYVKPELVFEEITEEDELMSASNPGTADAYYGGGDGTEHYEGGNVSGTGEYATDDEWAVGAKGGYLAFNDFEYSL